MHLRPEPVQRLSALRQLRPLRRGARFGAEGIQVERERGEVLEKPDEDERHLVVRKLGPPSVNSTG